MSSMCVQIPMFVQYMKGILIRRRLGNRHGWAITLQSIELKCSRARGSMMLEAHEYNPKHVQTFCEATGLVPHVFTQYGLRVQEGHVIMVQRCWQADIWAL